MMKLNTLVTKYTDNFIFNFAYIIHPQRCMITFQVNGYMEHNERSVIPEINMLIVSSFIYFKITNNERIE